MRERWLFVANLSLVFLTGFLTSTLQSAMWFQLFGSLPAPHLWLPIAVYLCLYRRPTEGILSLYLMTLGWVNLTVVPLGFMMFLMLAFHTSLLTLKERVFWPGLTYFMLTSALAAFLLPLFQIILSWIFEPNPIRSPRLIAWVVQTAFTALFAIPLYPFLLWLDRVTEKEQPTETGTQVL